MLAVIIVAALAVGIAGFVRSLGERPDPSVDTSKAAGAASSLAGGESAAPSDASRDASADTPAGAPAPGVDTAPAVDAALAVLADYSDAARPTEDALYAAIETLRAASTPDEVSAAQTQVDQASAAVKTDAEAYRAQLAQDAEGTSTQPTGGDVAAQMAYLHTYVFDYNTAEWGDYNSYGGDCTNFASQGLIARGWQNDRTWYSKGAMWTASKPWIATAAMAAYFDQLGFSYSTQDDLDRVRVGDIGLFNWGETGASMDHTMTVSKVEYVPGGPPVVSFISHNYDGEFRELTHALSVEHTDSTVRIYHIP